MYNYLEGQKKLWVILGVFFHSFFSCLNYIISFRFLVGLTSVSVNSDVYFYLV